MWIRIGSVVRSPRIGRGTLVELAIRSWVIAIPLPLVGSPVADVGCAGGWTGCKHTPTYPYSSVERCLLVPVSVVFADTTAIADRATWDHAHQGTVRCIVEDVCIVDLWCVIGRRRIDFGRTSTAACISRCVLVDFNRISAGTGQRIIEKHSPTTAM